MAFYQKKPIVIEAVTVERFLSGEERPQWAMDAAARALISLEANLEANGDPHLKIKTLEGTMRAEASDWIIQGVKGEIYPCKPDIFEATYQRVDRPEEA